MVQATSGNPKILHRPSIIARLYHKTHWFTDHEAWTLYKLFAFAEAIGWTLLIAAIIYRALDLPGYAIAITIAGRIHGLFFSLYFLFVLLTARSLQWGSWRVLGGLLAGVPPYGSLVYEKIMEYRRKKYPVYVMPPAGND